MATATLGEKRQVLCNIWQALAAVLSVIVADEASPAGLWVHYIHCEPEKHTKM